jgi:hypothetical protein
MPQRIFADDFASDPLASGWTPTAGGTYGKDLVWAAEGPRAGRRSLSVVPAKDGSAGGWHSPPFAVKDKQWYRATFLARTPRPIYFAAFFYDPFGAATEGDFYTSVDPTSGWAPQEFYFRTKFPGRTAAAVFQPLSAEPLHVADLSVEPVGRAKVAAWAGRLYATMPPLAYDSPPDAGRLIPRTIRKLQAGGALRVVLLGDSISNDLSNSPFDVLLRGPFPKAKVDVRFTGRGGTGWMKHRFQVRERVLGHKPDLAIFLAISNDPARIRGDLGQIVDAVRAAPGGPEMLIVTPHMRTWNAGETDMGLRQREVALAVAADQHVEVLDLTTIWGDYLDRTGKPEAWLLRDSCHMNERGRQVAARALVAHLAAGAKSAK